MSAIIEEVIRSVRTLIGANCDNCGANIPFVFPDRAVSSVNGLQGRDMLHITFTGGYGEYIDGRARFHMCKECATKLAEAFPAIQKALDSTDLQTR